MTDGHVRLTGMLTCATQGEGHTVELMVAENIALTVNDPGCLRFSVRRRSGSLIWEVDEVFDSTEAFRAHQARVQQSAWGKATAHIARDYVIHGL